jgi:hypothetical protein
MATNLSSTGLEVAKVEEEDIATGGTDKVLLYASGSGSDTKLYVKSGGNTQQQLGFDIDQLSEFDSTAIAQGDMFAFSDAGVEKKIDFSNLEDAIFSNMNTASGDVAVAAGGAISLADDSVGADELAANAVVEASIVDNAVTLAKMAGITRGSIILGDSSGDPSLLAKGSSAQFLQSDGTDPSYVTISGDASVAAGGALTIGTGVVEHAMLAADCVDGDNIQNDVVNSEHIALGALDAEHFSSGSIQTGHVADNQVTLAKMAGLAAANFILGDSNGDPAAVAMSGDVTLTNAGVAAIGAQKVLNSMLADDAVGADELAANAVVEASIVDNAVTLAKMAGITRGSIILGDSSGDPSLLAKGTAAQFLQSDGTDPSYVTISGDAAIAAGGALTIAANAVEGSMLNSNVAGSGLDYSSNELSVDVSDFMANGANNRIVTATGTDAMNAEANLGFNGSVLALAGAMSGSGDLEMGGGFIVSGSSTVAVNSGTGLAVGVGGYSGAGVTLGSAGTVQAKGAIVGDTTLSIGGGYSDGGSGLSVSAAGALEFNGALTVGSAGEGVDSTFHGGTSGEAFIFDASENHIKIQNSSAATLVTMGGNATSDYGVDVGGGSAGTNNINKVRASAFVTFSDESLKKDIEQMNGALDTVMSLKGVEFTWKNSDARDFGFIAQDVQEILPQAVHESAGVHGVDYSRLTSVLVEAVKAQQVQIEELKAILKK